MNRPVLPILVQRMVTPSPLPQSQIGWHRYHKLKIWFWTVSIAHSVFSRTHSCVTAHPTKTNSRKRDCTYFASHYNGNENFICVFYKHNIQSTFSKRFSSKCLKTTSPVLAYSSQLHYYTQEMCRSTWGTVQSFLPSTHHTYQEQEGGYLQGIFQYLHSLFPTKPNYVHG